MTKQKPIPAQDKTVIAEISSYLIQNLRHNITIHELTNKYYITRTRLLQLFKSVHGVSLKAFVISKRMDVALKMLLETDKPIDEIARLTGYKHPNNFTRKFTQYYGKPPHDLRKVNEKS
jgi:YesN/AraC family two-component response regulator